MATACDWAVLSGLRKAGKAACVGLMLSALAACAGGATQKDRPTVTAEMAQATKERAMDLAERAVDERRFDDARKLVQRVLISEPGNLRAHLIQAEALRGAGQPGKAASSFEKILAKDELPPQLAARAHQGYGLSLLFQGKPTTSREHLQKAVAFDRTLWQAWNGLGYLHDLEDEWDKSEFAYGQALAVRPDSAPLLNNRGFSRMMQGKSEAALADLQRSLRLDPELEVAETNLRLALASQGAYANALSGVPSEKRSDVLNNIGFMALIRGDYDNAEAYLRQAMDSDASFNKAAHRNLAYLESLKQSRSSAIASQADSEAEAE